jgi:hypothetical protein
VGHLPDENPLLLPMNDENFFDNKKVKAAYIFINLDNTLYVLLDRPR